MVDLEKIAHKRLKARIMCGYLLCAEVNSTRREAVATATDSELRKLVEEEANGSAPRWFRKSILEALDFIDQEAA